MTETSPATKWTIWLSLAAVAGTAAVASYLHALTVVQAADGPAVVAWFIAGLADPAIFAASVNILDASRRGVTLPKWSMLSIAVAVLVTLAANVAAGAPHSVPAWLVNVWPPVAFLMALESLMSFIRRGRGSPGPVAVAAAGQCGHRPAMSLDEAIAAAAPHMTQEQLAAAFGPSRTTIRRKLAKTASAPSSPAGAVSSADPPRPARASLNGHAGG